MDCGACTAGEVQRTPDEWLDFVINHDLSTAWDGGVRARENDAVLR